MKGRRTICNPEVHAQFHALLKTPAPHTHNHEVQSRRRRHDATARHQNAAAENDESFDIPDIHLLKRAILSYNRKLSLGSCFTSKE